jgi:CRISPR-associated protein Cmr2
MSEQQYLLLWSCGPVQEFIATARRTLDLWFGSHLLSAVARHAARSAVKAGAEGLLPSVGLLSGEGVPNKLLFRLRSPPEEVVKEMNDAARALLRALAEQAADRAERAGAAVKRMVMLQQVEDLLELSWASVLYDGQDLPGARRQVEALLAATKAHRGFSQPEWGGPAPKSSLDGAREAVLLWPGGQGEARQRAQARRLRMRPREMLDGVSLLKRIGPDLTGVPSESVPSVSAFALLPYLEAVEQAGIPGAEAHWRRYLDYVRDCGVEVPHNRGQDLPLIGEVDAHLLYASRLQEYVDEPRSMEAELARLLRAWKTSVRREPGAYYAILLADGDRMGALLDSCRTEAELLRASEALGAFAQTAPELVRSHGGRCVYAGGDDVLALLPIHRTLDIAAKLRDQYREKVTAPLRGIGDMETTLSVGIAIVHHLEPLSEALAQARSAEKAAKAAGRNAWCIRLCTRSGADLPTAQQWAEGERPFGDMPVLVELLRKGELPRGLPYDLRLAVQRLPAEQGQPGMVRAELRRLLQQKQIKSEAFEGLIQGLSSQAEAIRLAERMIIARALTGQVGGER